MMRPSYALPLVTFTCLAVACGDDGGAGGAGGAGGGPATSSSTTTSSVTTTTTGAGGAGGAAGVQPGEAVWSFTFDHLTGTSLLPVAAQSDGTALVVARPGGSADTLIAVTEGQEAWTATTPRSSGLAVSPIDDAVVVAGSLLTSADFGGGVLTSAGGLDAAIAVFDADGTHRWSAVFGDAAAQHFYYPTVGPDGVITVVGTFQGTMDLGGGALTAAGAAEGFVAQFDADGAHLMSRSLGSPAGCGGLGRVGGLLVPCSGSRTIDGVTITDDSGTGTSFFALDEAGDVEWQLGVTGPGNQNAWPGHFDDEGRHVMLVSSTSAISLGSLSLEEGFSLVRVSTDGEPLSAEALPAVTSSMGFDYHAPDGSFLVRTTERLLLSDADLSTVFDVAYASAGFAIAPSGDVLVTREQPGDLGIVELLSR